MSENLYCGTHKSSNPKSRKGHDDIEWDGDKNMVACTSCGLVHDDIILGDYLCPRCSMIELQQEQRELKELNSGR